MAKCCTDPKTGKAVRVSDKEAAELVAKGGKYLSKGEWQRLTHAQTGAEK